MFARRVTLSGPVGTLTQGQIETAAGLFRHFARQPGHAGGHLLVDRDSGCFCATSFWESEEAMVKTASRVEQAAKNMSESIWGSAGKVEIDIFEVVGLKPATAAIDIPDAES